MRRRLTVIKEIQALLPEANELLIKYGGEPLVLEDSVFGQKVWLPLIQELRDIEYDRYGFWYAYVQYAYTDDLPSMSLKNAKVPTKEEKDFYMKCQRLSEVGFFMFYESTGRWAHWYDHTDKKHVEAIDKAYNKYFLGGETPIFEVTDDPQYMRVDEDGEPGPWVGKISGVGKAASTFPLGLGESFSRVLSFASDGYTDEESDDYLKDFGRDLIEDCKAGLIDPCVGREKELQQLEMILARRKKNNPVLVGKAGTGKSQIVYGLAHKMASNDYDGLLKGKRIIEMNISKIMSGMKYVGELEKRVNKILDKVINSENILFIDEMHTMMGAGSTSTDKSGDISNMLKPYLADGRLSMIGATTDNEYSFIVADPATERRFNKVEVKEMTYPEVQTLLKNVSKVYAKHHGVSFRADLLEALPYAAKNSNPKRMNPDISIDVLDSLGVYTRQKGKKQATKTLLKEMMAEMYDKKDLVLDKEVQEIPIGFKTNR